MTFKEIRDDHNNKKVLADMTLFFFLALANGSGYAVAISRAKSVPMFGPALPPGGIFKKDQAFADFLLSKIINAENAAHLSGKFVSMAIR